MEQKYIDHRMNKDVERRDPKMDFKDCINFASENPVSYIATI